MAFETIPKPSPVRMTDAEYERWLEGEGNRGELVDFELEEHEPVSWKHVSIAELLSCLLVIFRESRDVGRSIVPPYPIRFRKGFNRIPDLMFVSSDHVNRIRPTYLDGPPDVAWEIVSPDSVDRDWRQKLLEYERNGVREYWIIDPLEQQAAIYLLGPDGYVECPEVDGKLVSQVIDGFWIRTDWLWQDPLPKATECLREMGALP